ncbi:hypothetical protein BHM03_00027078 [Ensete ventricosum]|nr:hypothetical protein BHM03_00027078 [Ensete ventricosum]
MAPRFEEQGQLQLLEREEDEEEDCFESIDKRKYLSARLIAQGINAGDIKKLQDAGIYTCNGLMMHTKKVCSPVPKVDKICEAAEKLVIVDSVIALFRVDFCGRGELAERQPKPYP